MSGIDYAKHCPQCDRPYGEHTIQGYGECLQLAGFNYELPYEDIPDGGFNAELRGLAGEVSIAACVLESELGHIPALRFIFTGMGDGPMERKPYDPITLVMDARGLMGFQRLVTDTVRGAIGAAEKAAKE